MMMIADVRMARVRHKLYTLAVNQNFVFLIALEITYSYLKLWEEIS